MKVFLDERVNGPDVALSGHRDDFERLLVDDSQCVQSCGLVIVEDDLVVLVDQERYRT